jgi:hypothetical protein
MAQFACKLIGVVSLSSCLIAALAQAQDTARTPIGLAQQAPLGGGRPQSTKIAEGLYTFTHNFARNVFLVTAEGVIVTDPLSPESAAFLRDEIRKVTDKPVRWVL